MILHLMAIQPELLQLHVLQGTQFSNYFYPNFRSKSKHLIKYNKQNITTIK